MLNLLVSFDKKSPLEQIQKTELMSPEPAPNKDESALEQNPHHSKPSNY